MLGPKECSILANVENEDILIETVMGQKSMSNEFGDMMFGKMRILKDRHGSVLLSQYSLWKMYHVFNPDEDTFVLKVLSDNPLTKERTWYFVRDKERYGNKLLHCTIKLEMARCF